MADSRTKNTLRNLAFGIINKVVAMALPFITRTVVLHLLGVAYLGVGTLFSSILSFLSVAELGIGSAMVYAMYKPIAQGDIELVSALLRYYRKLYRIIGIVILGLGIAILPLVPVLMNGNAPEGINAYALYLIYLINSVISYFFAGYRQCLFTANQRSDIPKQVATVVNVVVQIGEILALCLTRNFYVYALVPIVGTLITNFCNALITGKMYPEITCRGEIPAPLRLEIRKRVGGLFGTKLNSVVVHSADVMVVSSFLGLAATAQYGNYYYILNTVCGFVMILYSSMMASIGNKLVVETKETCYLLFKNLSFMNAWIVTWCSVCFVCLYEPFIKIWVGEEMQLGIGFAILMAIYFFVYEIQRVVLTFKDAAGLWHKDKLRPYVSMIINITSNLILVQIVGIYGIVLSTILAFAISFPWANSVMMRNVFGKASSESIIHTLVYFGVAVVIGAVTYLCCSFLKDDPLGFILRIAVCCTVPNMLFILVFHRKNEFRYLIHKGMHIIRKKTGGRNRA